MSLANLVKEGRAKDEALLRHNLQILLQGAGYRVTTAANGEGSSFTVSLPTVEVRDA